MSSSLPKPHQPKWWKEATMYEIYPASFKDSNNDGIGDIQGIISQLDFLVSLGVDVIWLAPHYKSPQVDMGYDISDFEDIHEPYGNLDDCLQLIDEVHKRGMKIIFDLVVNHTSDQHIWFKESRSSKSNPKRDWYLWKPPKFSPTGERLRPNNWRSQFTVPAWTWDEQTQEYYLHVYASAQPDLNWENEECRKAIYDTAIRFWLERGVDGFRIDTVNRYSKVPGLPDAPIMDPADETQPAVPMCTNGPRIHEYLREIRDVIDEYCRDGRDIFVVGELPATPELKDVLRYISPQSPHSRAELDMVFNFDTVDLGKHPKNRFDRIPFTKSDFKSTLTQWQSLISDGQTWTTTFLENHDQPRSVSRFGSDTPSLRGPSAKMLSILLCTLSGTLFLYQGQELGMVNMPPDWSAEEYLCVRSQNFITDIRSKSQSLTPESKARIDEAQACLQRVGRDHARVPMQWTGGPHGGFCPPTTTPWMRALDDSPQNNAADQLANPTSVFHFWKKMLALRKKFAALTVYGHLTVLDSDSEDLFVYTKSDPAAFTASNDNNSNKKQGQVQEKILVVANLSDQTISWTPPSGFNEKESELLMTNTDGNKEVRELTPFEARVYLLRLPNEK